MSIRLKNLSYGLLFHFCFFTTNLYAENISGLWLDSQNNYWALLQAQTSNNPSPVIAIQLANTFQDGLLYIGDLTNNTLQLSQFDGTQLNATLDGSRFQGDLIQGNLQSFRAANVLFPYQGGLYDGLWQWDASNYSLLLTVSYLGSNITLALHINIANPERFNTSLYIGLIENNGFEGVSLLNDARLQLVFTAENRLDSHLISSTQTIPSNAEKIFSAAQSSPVINSITVTSNQDSGAGSLRQALADAQSGDQIGFAPSLANQTITLSSGQLVVNKTLTIDGSNAPNLILHGDDKYRLFDVQKDLQGNAITVTLRHLNLTHGRTFKTGEEGAGGAIRTANFTTLIVENSSFSHNIAGGEGGGGIFAGWQSNTTIINSRFEHNDGTPDKRERGGGAIVTKSGSHLVVKDSYFSDNKGINGGAINSLLGELTVINSTFLNNEAIPNSANTAFFGLGGAIATDGANASGANFGPGDIGGEIIIQHSYFENNRALDGGALNLYAYQADKVLVENSLFVGNQTIKNSAQKSAHGGGIRHDNSEFILRNSSFYNNTALGQGGGLWVDKNSPTIISNVTFSANKSGNDAAKDGLGGGMAIYSPSTITNATFTQNYATGHSGAIFTGNQTDITVTNSIFSNNAIGEPFLPLQTVNRKLIDGGNNLQSLPLQAVKDLETVKVTSGITIADPKLGELQTVNGMLLHPLLLDSPAIDAGNNKTATTRDAAGKLRPLDGNADGIAVSDIGAYEK